MKGSDIIRQLHAFLPKFTSLFSDTLAVTSMVFAGGTVTVTTAAAHNLTTDDTIVVDGALSPNPITTLTSLDGIATAETTNDHHLTELWPHGEDSTIEISGSADPEYNGTKKLLFVPNRKKFTYKIDSGAPVSTTGGVLDEVVNFGYNGLHQITVTGSTTFTYPITATVGTPATGTIILSTKTRISGGIVTQKIIDSYTKQAKDDYWGFVIIEPRTASKSRTTLNDADFARGPGDDPRQKIIQNLSFYVFVPCKDEIAARASLDTMDDLLIALFKSLLGFKPPSPLGETPQNGISYVSDELLEYRDSFLVYRFQFQNLIDITSCDTFIDPIDNAFRDIHIDYIDPIVTDGDDIIMTSDIDLDDEPL